MTEEKETIKLIKKNLQSMKELLLKKTAESYSK